MASPGRLAAIHEVKLRWNDPTIRRTPEKVYDSMFPIVEAAYHARGGKSPQLPGRAELIKGGRADVRFSIDADGELYLYSKGDGMIRRSSKRWDSEDRDKATKEPDECHRYCSRELPTAREIASPRPAM